MAIVNMFPVADSELAPVYQVEGIFPALIYKMPSGNYYNISHDSSTHSGGVYLPTEEGATHYSGSITLYPVRPFVISFTARDPDSAVPQNITVELTLDPGHVYQFSLSSYAPSELSQGGVIVQRDGEVWKQYVRPAVLTTTMFAWKLPEEE